MNENTQTLTGLSVENQTFYDRTLLERYLPQLSFYNDGKKKKIPKGKGNKIEWRKFNSLKPATTPLTEGITPSGNSLDITSVIKQLHQYGDYVIISDVLETQSKDPIITETSELLGEQAGLTTNKLIGIELTTGTNVRYADGKTSRETLTSTSVLKGSDIKKAVRDLARNNVPRFDDGFYHATISPEQAYDLKNDTEAGSWLDANKYSNRMALIKNEIGCYGGVRFIESSETPKATVYTAVTAQPSDWATNYGKYYVKSGDEYVLNTATTFPTGGVYSADECIHQGIIYGKDTYGVPEIGQNASHPSIIVKTKGSAGTNDPLNQRSSIGWKNDFAVKRLQELGIIRLESRVSE
ncbi:MAG: N4-gp56 family major capsid protein [Bacilli bacterium]|nr:N4-gp56 family major capsid protein [Bacilli bacterium]